MRPPVNDGPLPVLPDVEERALLRKAMGVTIREASMEIGVSTTSYTFWERGARVPRAAHLRAYYAQLYRWYQAVNAE